MWIVEFRVSAGEYRNDETGEEGLLMKRCVAALVFAMVPLAFGCGSDSSSEQPPALCGPGTYNSGGVCVVADAGHSETQSTDGAGGTSGVDAAADVTQQPDGDQPDVAPPLDASEEPDAPGPDAAQDAQLDQDAEAAAENGEPCLSEYTLNCTYAWGEPSCSPSDDECEPHVCQQNAYKIESLPFTMRMPSGLMPALVCSECVYSRYAVLLEMRVEPDPNMRVRIRVGTPWEIVVNPLTMLENAYCGSTDPDTGCVVTGSDTWFHVGITTPQSWVGFERNVVIDQVPVGTTCP